LPPEAASIVLIQASWVCTIWWAGPAQYAIRRVCFCADAGATPHANAVATASNVIDAVRRMTFLPWWFALIGSFMPLL
jgi:hypothetical protein